MPHTRKKLKIERNNAPVFKMIRTGADGSLDVAEECIKLIQDINFFDGDFERFAVKTILLDNNLTSYSPLETRLQAVYSFVQKKIAYVSDIKSLESIKDARQTISDGFGDCDDQTVLVATLLSVLGITPTLCLVKTLKQKLNAQGETVNYKTNDFNHIYCVHITDDKIFILDTVLQTKEFNQKADNILEEKYLPVYSHNANQAMGIDNVFTKVKEVLTGFGKALVPAVRFLPIPFSGKISEWISSDVLGVIDDTYSTIATRINANLDSLIEQVKKNKLNYKQAIEQASTMITEYHSLIKNVKNVELQKNLQTFYNSIVSKFKILESLKQS